MEDFHVVERFDPTKVGERETVNDETEILAKLKNKIKKRKIEYEQEETVVSEEPATKKKKKEKKKKRILKPENESESEQVKDERKEKEIKEPSKFTPIGQNIIKKKLTVKRVLPNWLQNPDIAEIDYLADMLPITDMEGLDTVLVNHLQELGFENYFPVQRQVIPIIQKPHKYRPHDVCVSAPTGSGKTLTFVLPILQALKSRVVPKVRAIVVVPTVNLVQQVFKVFQLFANGTGLKVKALSPNTFEQEQKQLYRIGDTGIIHQCADILISTPFRLVNIIRETEILDLTALRYLVIDEADQIVMDIRNDWLSVLESAVYSKGRNRPGPLNVINMRKRELPLQKLLFSATIGQDPEKLELLNLFEPKLFRCIVPSKDLDGKVIANYGDGDVPKFSIPAELIQYKVTAEIAHKPLMVKYLMDKFKFDSVLVFTKSKEATHRLCLVLANLGYDCKEVSANINKEEREKIVDAISNKILKIVVCSDALARGIDIDKLDGVISYDAPSYTNTYIHRVGRTARAGRQGTAITILEQDQELNFDRIVEEVGSTKVEQYQVDQDEFDEEKPRYMQALDEVKKLVIKEQQKLMEKNRQRKQQH